MCRETRPTRTCSSVLAKYRITVRATCRVVDDLSTIAMVESGFGILHHAEPDARTCARRREIYAIEPMEYREFGIAVLNPQMMAPAVRQMAMFIESFRGQKRREAPATNAGFDPENHVLTRRVSIETEFETLKSTGRSSPRGGAAFFCAKRQRGHALDVLQTSAGGKDGANPPDCGKIVNRP